VEFISFWYQSFGSKISFVYLSFFIQFPVPCCVKKKTKTKKKQKKNKKKRRRKCRIPVKKKKKNSSFQSCFSKKKIVLVPERKKFLHFNLVSTRK
jgi:hypothetical protein